MVKKILTRGLLVVLALVVILVIAIALQPNSFRVERSTTIAAPPSAVYTFVNDFHYWDRWSPWAKMDPNCKFSFEGPDEGKGAKFNWAGNDEVGTGSMTIIESKPDELVQIELKFVKPFEDTALTELAMKPEGDQTRLTWTMSGENNFIAKAFCMLMDMDKMIGEKYEEGLANLKKAVEAEATGGATEPATPEAVPADADEAKS